MKGQTVIYMLIFLAVIFSFFFWQYSFYKNYESPSLSNCSVESASVCAWGTYCDINSASEFQEGEVVKYGCKPWIHSVVSSLKLPIQK